MKNSFRLKLSKTAYAAIVAMSIVFAAVIVVNIVNLCRFKASENASFGLNIFAVVMLFLLLAMCALITFNSRYVLKEKAMRFYMGVFFTSIPYENMRQIRTDGKTYLLYYTVFNKKEGEKITFMRLNCTQNEKLAKKLLEIEQSIKYEFWEA